MEPVGVKQNNPNLKKLTITGIFNDYFTNYEDKESSVTMTVDLNDCTCTLFKKCYMHRENSVLTDIV
jgi:hypothetical protein